MGSPEWEAARRQVVEQISRDFDEMLENEKRAKAELRNVVKAKQHRYDDAELAAMKRKTRRLKNKARKANQQRRRKAHAR